MNFWTFIDRNGYGCFWVAIILGGGLISLAGVALDKLTTTDHRCDCRKEAAASE